MILKTLLFLCLTLTCSVAQTAITTEEAAAQVGKTVTIRGLVVQVRSIDSGLTFFNFGDRHPNSTFTVVIRPGTAELEALKAYEGKEVEVTGTVALFKERPQIVLDSITSLRLAGETAPADASATTPAVPASPAQPGPEKKDATNAEPNSSSTFTVPLTIGEIKIAGTSPEGVSPKEATVAVQLPPDFDPSQPQRALLVFATDDGGGGHVKALPRFARVANEAGWVAIAANGPVLENRLSSEWHATMILAALRSLGEKYPGLKSWTFYTGGNSGGAARASMMVGALLAKGYDVRGTFMGGSGGEHFSTGTEIFRPAPAKMKKLAVFVSLGKEDHLVSEEKSDGNMRVIQDLGIRKIKRDIYDGGHGMNEESLARGLNWLAAES